MCELYALHRCWSGVTYRADGISYLKAWLAEVQRALIWLRSHCKLAYTTEQPAAATTYVVGWWLHVEVLLPEGLHSAHHVNAAAA